MKSTIYLYEEVSVAMAVGGAILVGSALAGLGVFIANKIRDIPIETKTILFEIMPSGHIVVYYMNEYETELGEKKKFNEKVISKEDYQKLLNMNSAQLTKQIKKLGKKIRAENSKVNKYNIYISLKDNPNVRVKI